MNDKMADIKRLALAESFCGPEYHTWGPAVAMDWSKVRIVCLAPIMTGKGELMVGPIKAVKSGTKVLPTEEAKPASH